MSNSQSIPINPEYLEEPIIMICGPSGGGKTSVIQSIVSESPQRFQRVVTSTSRSPRPGEQHGIDYYFYTKPSHFEMKKSEGAFVESDGFSGSPYGTEWAILEPIFKEGKTPIVATTLPGVPGFQKFFRKVCPIFLMPGNLEELRARLMLRPDADSATIERRMRHAEEEMKTWKMYCRHVVVNEEGMFPRTVEEVKTIIDSY